MKFNPRKFLSTKQGIASLAGAILLSIIVFAPASRGEMFSRASQQDAARAKAELVLRQAREATRKDSKYTEIKGLVIASKSNSWFTLPAAAVKASPQLRNKKIQETIDEEWAVNLPDKIRYKIVADHTINQEITEWVVNGERFWQKMDVSVDGAPVNFVSNAKPKTEQEEVAKSKNFAFTTLFPITLDYSWNAPIEFRYIGVAEAKGTKADAIETILPDNTKYRFFFDQQTHLLLLATQTWTGKANKEVERKYFFSDYRKEDGLLVAHKIISEEMGEVVSEKQIERVQINPTFKPDYFAVKGK